MNKAVILKHHVPVAGTWNELNRTQLLRLMRVLLTPKASPEDVDTRLVSILLQLWKRPLLAGTMLRMPLLDVATLRLLTRAFLQQPVQLTRQLLPQVHTGPAAWRTAWHGPLDQLAGLTFEEWIAAEDAYFRHRQGQPGQLQRLVAVLYRPAANRPQPNGDRREPFSQYSVEARALVLAELRDEHRQAILFFYDSCRSSIIARFSDLFPGKEFDDDPATKPVNPTRNYLMLMRELAGSPDRFELIGQQPLSNIFFDLNERIAESHQAALEPDHD